LSVEHLTGRHRPSAGPSNDRKRLTRLTRLQASQCLLFALFNGVLRYFASTLLSMAVLYWVVSMALELTTRVAAALGTSSQMNSVLLSDTSEDPSSQAMQQSDVGLILAVLIISTPPMAAMLFNGTIGSFSPYATVNGGGSGSRPGPPGSYGGYGSNSANSTPTSLPGQQATGGFSNPANLPRGAQTAASSDAIKPFEGGAR
jgi:type IV secretion system protein VirB6